MTFSYPPSGPENDTRRRSTPGCGAIALDAQQRDHRANTLLHEALVDSFPASDPISSLRFD